MRNRRSPSPQLSDDELSAMACDAAVELLQAADLDLANKLSREMVARGISHATACIAATNVLAWMLTEKGVPVDFEDVLLNAVRILLQASIKSVREKERRAAH